MNKVLLRWTVRRFVAAFGLVLLLLTGCGSSADTPATTDTGTAAAEPTTANAAVDEADSDESQPAEQAAPDTTDDPSVNESYVSPIGEALGISQDEVGAAFDTFVRDAEELTRQCMADAGFEYTPTQTTLNPAASRQFELEASLTTEQFTQEYGFGIATLFELNFKGEGVIAFVNQQFGPPPSAGRSPSEQQAYDIALTGETIEGLSAEDAQEQLFGDAAFGALDGSCRAYGFDTAENPGAVYDDLFSLLGDEWDALGDRFDSEPRVRDARAEWQTCMAAKGHSYESRFEIFDELQGRANALADQYLTSTQVLTALGRAQQEDFASMDGQARAAFLEDVGALQGFSWVPEVQAEVDELTQFELLVAADSAECADEDLLNQVQFELETEFVAQHADQLALIRAGEAAE